MFSKWDDNNHIIYIWASRQNNPVSQSAVQPSVSGKSILLSNSFDYHFKLNKLWRVTHPALFVCQMWRILQTVWLEERCDITFLRDQTWWILNGAKK